MLERRWGVLFQHGALFSGLTVRQNIQVPMREYLDLSQEFMDELALLKLDLDDALRRFQEDRARLVARLRELSAQDWMRTARHDIPGRRLFRS